MLPNFEFRRSCNPFSRQVLYLEGTNNVFDDTLNTPPVVSPVTHFSIKLIQLRPRRHPLPTAGSGSGGGEKMMFWNFLAFLLALPPRLSMPASIISSIKPLPAEFVYCLNLFKQRISVATKFFSNVNSLLGRIIWCTHEGWNIFSARLKFTRSFSKIPKYRFCLKNSTCDF